MSPTRYLIPLLALAMFFRPPAAPAQQPKQLYVVTYIDVYPNFADDTSKALVQYAADCKKDAGYVRIEILQDVARANHFSLAEVWQSRQAFDAHLNAPHTKQFRDKLGPMIGAPFDERLYNRVP